MVFIQLVTPNGILHGLMEELSNDSKESDMEKLSPKIKAECEKRKKEDARIVKARYINHQEGLSGWLDKAYCRWPGERVQKWRLLHNHTYDLPMGFINEVNNGSWEQGGGLIKRSQMDGHDEKGTKKVGMEKIHELVPVGF